MSSCSSGYPWKTRRYTATGAMKMYGVQWLPSSRAACACFAITTSRRWNDRKLLACDSGKCQLLGVIHGLLRIGTALQHFQHVFEHDLQDLRRLELLTLNELRNAVRRLIVINLEPRSLGQIFGRSRNDGCNVARAQKVL